MNLSVEKRCKLRSCTSHLPPMRSFGTSDVEKTARGRHFQLDLVNSLSPKGLCYSVASHLRMHGGVYIARGKHTDVFYATTSSRYPRIVARLILYT